MLLVDRYAKHYFFDCLEWLFGGVANSWDLLKVTVTGAGLDGGADPKIYVGKLVDFFLWFLGSYIFLYVKNCVQNGWDATIYCTASSVLFLWSRFWLF